VSTGAQLDAFESLAKALGILDENGNANDEWFGDPVGEHDNERGLQHILRDDDQRQALLDFVDEVLGAPDQSTRDGATWVPLFREAAAHVTIFAVVKAVPGAVHVGIGVEHEMQGSAPRVATRVHVPVFRAQRGDTELTGGGPLPPWLMLGRAEGRIDIALDLTLRDDAPAAGEPSLGALAVHLGIPTDGTPNLRLAIELRDLQLPGASAPRTITLDAATPGELGSEVLELLATLVRAQVDALTSALPDEVAGLLGLLGLREVSNLPPLPLGELPTRGLDAIVDWFREVFQSAAARTAWFTQLAQVIDGGVDAGAQSASGTVGPLRFTVGVRTTTGSGGALVIIPSLALSLDTTPGARVRIAIDLLRADLATGAITAVPDVRAEALFGNQAGGGPLLTGDPGVGGLRAGLVLRDRQPAFSLTLHDVTLAGRPHALLDISSPGAAMTAVDSVVAAALDAAMAEFGAAGALIGKLLGIQAPAGVTGISSTALLADPLAELTRYWRDLSANAPAMANVLGALRALVASVPAMNVPGNGTREIPWRVALAAPLILLVWRDGDALVIDAALDITTPVLGDHVAVTTLRGSLLRLAFTPVQVTFVGSVSATVALRRTAEPLELAVGPLTLTAQEVRAIVSWSPARGLLLDIEAPGGAATLDLPRVQSQFALPLPVRDAAGTLTLPAELWPDVQSLIVALAAQARVRVIDELLLLIGWTGTGVELPLETLVSGDPAQAIRVWLADLLLDCGRARMAMGVVARIVSSGTVDEPLGAGSARSPYRAPVAGDPRAPALVAWLEPACPPYRTLGKAQPSLRSTEVPEDGATLMARLAAAAIELPDLTDLLTGRDALADGFEQLIARWSETDGIIPVQEALPAGVTLVRYDDASYDDMVAEGAAGMLTGLVLEVAPDTIIHVGCEETWRTDRPAGRTVDATGATEVGSLTATGTGEWFIALPTIAAARAGRTDHDAVAEQTDRLARVLAGRTAPVTIFAYGPCAAAAIRAAATRSVIATVVTVGAPWSAPSVTAFRGGLAADAMRVVQRLLRTGVPTQSPADRALTAMPLDVMRDVVTRTLAVAADDGALPNAGAESRRSGLTCVAVFGSLSEDTVCTGLGAVLDDGIARRFERAREAAGGDVPHTALHVGVDVPVIAASVGGVRVGLGATFDLVTLERSATRAIDVGTARSVTVRLQLGITDGWLVGGPSPEPSDVDVRWVQVNVTVPFDGSPGDTEFVLYEATGLGAFRERWVVRADADGLHATQALPEVRAIISGVVARLRTASPQFGVLLDVLGLVRDGGLDVAGLDRLLFEPELLAAQVRARAVELATSLRILVPGMTGSGSVLTWTVGPATLTLDAATRTFSAAITSNIGGVAPFSVSAAMGANGRAVAQFSLGVLDAVAGGVRLVGTAGAVNGVSVEWGRSGPGATRTMAVLPVPDVAQLTTFATTVLPAYVMQALADALRGLADTAGRAAIDAALDALSMLHAAADAGRRRMRLPIALFDDPAAWLLHGAEAWRTNPAGSAVQLLDALVPVIAPARGSAAGWPIVPGVTVHYAGVDGRLVLTLDATLNATVDTAVIGTRLVGGLRIGSDGRVEPRLDIGITVNGTGLQLAVTPAVELSLVRQAPAPLLRVYPAGAGLGSALAAVGESVLPPVLDALAARRTDVAASLIKDVGRAVFDLGSALDLLDGTNFSSPRLSNFASNPAARLLERLPSLVGTGAATLARALDPAASRVRVSGPLLGRLTLEFGSARQVTLVLDASSPGVPVIRLAATLAVPAVGNIVLEELRLASDGVGIAVRIGPAELSIGGVTLRPVLTVRAGVTGSTVTRMAALGLALDDVAAKSLELRWGLNALPPTLVVVTRSGTSESPDDAAEKVAITLLSIAASIASGLALPVLLPVLPPQAISGLEGVLLVTTGGSTVLDPTLFDDLLAPERLFTRLKRLAWNLATLPDPLGVVIGGVVGITLVAQNGAGTTRRLGVALTLEGGGKFEIASGDPTVTIAADASWITGGPVLPGFTLTLLEGHVTPTDVVLELVPGFTVGGVGLVFSKMGGPLLNLGPISLDGIGVYLFGEVSSAGIGAGVQVELSGLAIAPSGAGGNPVAGGILSDAAEGGANNRPAFSPAIAVLARAGGDVGVSVRAGQPPGPWWLVIQRELGPLYLEQIGFDSRSEGGSITRLQLIFDGRVSLFGMTAAVDQLSLTWTGGDLFDASRWQADLMGLAVSADMGGIVLAGGLLKDANGGYLGMLLGRFGPYGLTVYGGYALMDGNPSFFIFGALNGPIGGPPAFFVTGIGAGLGINRQLRVPDDFSGFKDYPFIKALDIAAEVGDPMAELRKLNDYFRPQVGQFWVAAGLSFTCFALVDGIAVIAVAFGSDGIDVNLLGLARMALPRPQLPLVSIELGLIARFSTREGIFSIRAQLTENSWLIYPEVRLTGGFAFVVWWKGPLAGQFVLTIGGYHPRFHRDGYPDVPRVGLVWQVSNAIVIKGGAYFALTSEALMFGIEVVISADFGFAWARIEFGANGIIYFDPFWFEVEAYAMISAGVKVKTFLGTIRFSLSTGASLVVSGPEFGGKASFHVGPVKITVPFGSQAGRPGDVLDWPAFVGKYLEAGEGGGARALSCITGLGTLTRKAGNDKAASADGSAARPYEVFGEFEISITSTVPITSVVLGPSNTSTGLAPKRSDGALVSMGLAPMNAENFSSKLNLDIVGTSAEVGVAGPKPGVLDGQVERIRFDVEAFPIGAWGEPDSSSIKPIPQGDVIFAMNRVRFDLRTVQPDSRLPAITYRRVTHGRAVLPLQAQGGQRPVLFAVAATVNVPAPSTTAAAMLEASSRLFGARSETPVDGLQARGTPGALAKAAFHGDRVAPPLFGTLADGLRRTNVGDVASAPVPPPPPGAVVRPRPPKLAGMLGGGAGVIERGPRTSVLDGRLKRRPAPSIESVRSRVTRQLPVQLARTARPGANEAGTLLATGVVPFTAAPGTSRSLSVGRTVSPSALGELIGGLRGSGRLRSKAQPETLHAGDLVVLHAPDANIDLDEQLRPRFSVTGQVRVTMTSSGGTVLLDATVTDSVVVPPRTAMIGVQAAGDTAVRDGLAGWHERSRLARLSGRVAMGPGCTLQVEGVVSEAPPAWVAADDLLVQATVVTTRFTGPVTTIAIVLAGSDTPDGSDVTLELDGATRVADKGVPRAPRVVMSGARAVLLYEVKPTRGSACTVRVQSGGQWRLSGVMGGEVASATLAQTIAVKGIYAVSGRLLLAADGAAVRVTWEPAPASRSAPAPNTSARKTGARKTSARKTSARKTSARKTSAGKTSARKTDAGKTGAGKTGARKTDAGKTDAGRTGAGRTSAGRTSARKTTADRSAARKTSARKTSARKTTATGQTTRRGTRNA